MASAIAPASSSSYPVSGATPTAPVMPTAAPLGATVASAPSASSSPAPAAQSSGILSFLENIWSGIVNFVKGIWSKLFGGSTSAQPLDSTSAQIAQQYNLLPTEANVQAFLVEARSYEQDGTIGPGSPPSDALKQIQQALANWGYQVTPSGTWDQATSSAVMAFKQKYGIHQTYQMADGSWGINAYVDNNTLAEMRQLSQNPPSSSSSPAPATQTAASVSNWQAVATQYGLLATQDNVQAFLTEVQSYSAGGALGPGSTDSNDIKKLQQLLHDKFGFSAITPSGTWDSPTSQAVIAFKTKNGLHQTYKAADGNWAVNEYADAQTLKLLMQQAGLPGH